MRPALLALALIVAAPSAYAVDFVMIGKQGKVDTTFIACKNKDDTKKIKSLYSANDKEAILKFAISKIPDCRVLKEGTVGAVEDLSAWSGDSCLRPKGEPECFWLPTNFVVAP